MSGIADALSAGNLTLAAKVLWAGLNVAWMEGTANIRAMWAQAQASLAGIAIAGFANIQIAWADATMAFGDLWDQALNGMGGRWSEFQNSIASGLATIIARMEGLNPKDVQESLTEEQAGIKEQSEERKKARAQENADRRAQLEANLRDTEKELADDVARKNEAYQKEIQAAREAMQASQVEAGKAKTDAEAKRKNDTKGAIGTGNGENFMTGTMGTFSASAAARSAVAGVSPLQKGIDATAKNTEDTVAALENMGGLNFA
jgi:hypothetical protein